MQSSECQIPQTCCIAFKRSFVLANINIPGTSHDAGACQKSVDMVQYCRTIWVEGTGRTSWTSLSPAETIERSSRITNRYTQNTLTSTVNFEAHGSMHRNSMLIRIQPDATVCRYLFTAKSLYMFQVSQHPSSGVLKTVTAAYGTGHNIGTATSL